MWQYVLLFSPHSHPAVVMRVTMCGVESHHHHHRRWRAATRTADGEISSGVHSGIQHLATVAFTVGDESTDAWAPYPEQMLASWINTHQDRLGWCKLPIHTANWDIQAFFLFFFFFFGTAQHISIRFLRWLLHGDYTRKHLLEVSIFPQMSVFIFQIMIRWILQSYCNQGWWEVNKDRL